MFSMLSTAYPRLRWHPGQQLSRRRETRCFAGGAAVKFVIPYHCRFGQHLCLVGSVEQLGKWDVARGVEMNWSDGDVWRAELEIPYSGPPGSEAQVEYKYVVRNGDRHTAAAWTPGDNYVLKLPAVIGQDGARVRLHVRDSWDGEGRKVKVQLPGAPSNDYEEGGTSAAVPQAATATISLPPPPPPAVAAAAAAVGAPFSEPAVAIPPPPSQQQQQPAVPPPLPRQAAVAAAAPMAPEQQQLQSPASQPVADAGSKRRGRRRTKVASPAEDGSQDSDAVLAAITRESERAMQQLDAAISSSWELLEGSDVDPADPQLLAADRRLAAASQRAAAMYKALDAAAAQRLLGDGSGPGGLGNSRRSDE